MKSYLIFRISKVSLRRTIDLCLVAFFFHLSGCSTSEEVNVVAVDGMVTNLDKPIEGAQVVFHPIDSALQLPHRPIGVTDSGGKFCLTTFEQNDGAPVGEYVVTIKQLEPREVGEEVVRSGRNLLPQRYCEPGTSPLRYHVGEKNNVPANFVLSK